MAEMGESTIATSQSNISPLTGPSSLGSTMASPASDNSHYNRGQDLKDSMDHRVLSMRPSSKESLHHQSRSSSVERSLDEKQLDNRFSTYAYTVQANAQPDDKPPRESNGVPKNGYRQTNGPNRLSKPMVSKKEKRGGFRNTLRRMFGKSPKSRISMPTPMVYPQHVGSTRRMKMIVQY